MTASWSTFVNEKLYLAKLLLERTAEVTPAQQEAVRQSALLLLDSAVTGFFNELAVKRAIKDPIHTIDEFEVKMGWSSAESARLKALYADPHSALNTLKKSVDEIRSPKKPVETQLIASDQEDRLDRTEDLLAVCLEIKSLISELRESNSEY